MESRPLSGYTRQNGTEPESDKDTTMQSSFSRLAVTTVFLLAATAASNPAMAQDLPRPSDVENPESIVSAAYASIARAPGENYDWDRFRSLFLPSATMIPNTEQRGGEFDVLSVQGFIDWLTPGTERRIGTADDRGFSEDGIHNKIERFGDIAHVFSTYEKHFWGENENLGRGINSFQLVHNGGRWWISAIAWDEEVGGGPIPDEYLP